MIAISRCVRDFAEPEPHAGEARLVGLRSAVELGDLVAQNLVHAGLRSSVWAAKAYATARPDAAVRPRSILRLDLEHAGNEIGLRLDLDRPRPRNVDVVDRRDAPWPGRHDDDAVGEEDRLCDRVRDEGDRLAGLDPDFLDQEIHFIAGESVERPEGFVHQQERRIHREAPDDRGPLLHSARKLARELVFEALEIDPLEQMLDPLHVRPAPLQFERQRHVLEQIAPRQQIGVLEDHRNLGMRPGDDVLAEPDLAAGQIVQAGHRPQQGRLAATRRADDAEELALAHFERHVVQRMHRSGFRRVVLGRALDNHFGLRFGCAIRHCGFSCAITARRGPNDRIGRLSLPRP